MEVVSKKNGFLQICVDNQKLNAKMVRNTSPLPMLDECFESLGDTATFQTLNDNWIYWQVSIADKDKDKTAWTSNENTY